MGRAERVLMRGRRRAEALMIDSCRIRRPTGRTTGPDGVVTTTYDLIYPLPGAQPPVDGRCRIQTNDPYEQRPEAGEHSFTVVRDILQLPMAVVVVRVDDVVDQVVSEMDPALAGRIWRVAAPSRKTHQTMRRFYIAEVAG
ncbi:DUF6093 family protein [Jiangella asiatica]|uniref:Uncharacterized protein n=1 Tax=Jiangella asiatica TaxID=2530372 RepID=A0A4V2Z0Y0_9ACTN|nr:DUF6093 family protein [Jiangella asiatica]TDE02838.1 hypothetical protein E1269_21340 [Jiangella asiatica]